MTEIVEQWTGSPHADATAEAFTHWNEEGEVPQACAICHSGAGFRAFHGLDGSEAGVLDHPVETGGVIDCDTCHAEGTADLGPIRFPSGVTLSAGPTNATCMTCHQGRQSGSGVKAAVEGMAPDAVNAELSFLNPHYAAAAATMMGTEAGGLFEYEGRTYVARFEHAPEIEGCTTCHSPHSLKVSVELCVDCHKSDDPRGIRVKTVDFDGDGDTTEGIAGEIATLHEKLGAAMADYATRVAGAGLVYAPASYPYFFTDLNGNAMADPEEISRDNAYKAWTPRLLAAAYNYQFVGKDPGSYAHNAAYAMQVMIDSIADLSEEAAAGLARP